MMIDAIALACMALLLTFAGGVVLLGSALMSRRIEPMSWLLLAAAVALWGVAWWASPLRITVDVTP